METEKEDRKTDRIEKEENKRIRKDKNEGIRKDKNESIEKEKKNGAVNRSVTAVILMAGSGKRMHTEEKKQFLPLCGKPLFCASVERFISWLRCEEVLLVVGAEDKETVDGFVEQEGWRKEKKISIVEGGAERFDSVAAALHFIEEKGNPENYVFIHDAARPFFTEDLLEHLYKELQYSKAVIPGIPVKDTIKVERDGVVEKSLDRKTLYAVQTPQVFDFQVLSRAFKSFLPRREEWKDKITDDAMIVEEFSKERIRLIAGEEENIKITVKEDLRFLKEKHKNFFPF